jgi:hypothetical protein
MADADLKKLVQWFEASEQASQDARAESEQARDYYDSKQLTDDERRALRKKKQPPVIINRIGRKVDYLRGLERQSRTDPKAYPRTQQHAQDAEAITDALRYVSSDQNVDIKRSQVFENMLIEGMGGVEVIVGRGAKGVIDPRVVVIPWDRIFTDPHSSAHDYSDASYLGFVTWMDEGRAKAKWPDAEDVIKATIDKPTSSAMDTYDDKPRWATWYDAKRKRLRVVTMYYLDGDEWQRCEFTLAGELSPAGPSPWIDEDGKPECGLILQSAYVDRDNDRYGIVRSMISPQDEINKRRSKALHLLTSRQVRVSPNANMEPRDIKNELSLPDGVILADSGEVEVLQNSDMTAGHFQLLQEAKAEIDMMGPNAAMQGKGGSDSSGRAILAQQQGGMVEMAPLMDNLRHFTIRLFRQIWNRIRQFWDGERWIRVTDDDRNVRFVKLNGPELDPEEASAAMQRLGNMVREGRLPLEQARQFEAEIHRRATVPRNVIAELDVDIDISEINETPSLQIEEFEKLSMMAQSGVVPIPPEVLIEASGLRNKDKLLKMLEDAKTQQSAPNPMQELQQRGAMASVAKTEAEAALTGAKAQNEAIKPQFEAAKLIGQAQQPQPQIAA